LRVQSPDSCAQAANQQYCRKDDSVKPTSHEILLLDRVTYSGSVARLRHARRLWRVGMRVKSKSHGAPLIELSNGDAPR
jgi:hypothetical protein